MKIFVDCDVLIDVGLGRQPFCLASGELLDYLENHKNGGFIAWHSIANFFYLTEKGDNKQQRKNFIAELCAFLHKGGNAYNPFGRYLVNTNNCRKACPLWLKAFFRSAGSCADEHWCASTQNTGS